MQPLKILSRILIVIGILCFVIGLLSIFFLQITLGEISLQGFHTSDTFRLEKGTTYSIKATGSNYPFGSSGGELVLYLTDGTPVVSLNIQFSFDGDATSQEIIVADFQVPVTGDYYFYYNEAYNTVYNAQVKIIVQESIIDHYFGINSFELLFSGIPLVIGGAILPRVGGWISRRVSVPKTEYESFDTNSSSNLITGFDEISCPVCGNIDEGLYCSNCGSRLRE